MGKPSKASHQDRLCLTYKEPTTDAPAGPSASAVPTVPARAGPRPRRRRHTLGVARRTVSVVRRARARIATVARARSAAPRRSEPRTHALTALSPAHITGDVARLGRLRAQPLQLQGVECTDHKKHMIADERERKGTTMR